MRSEIEALFDHPPAAYHEDHFMLFARLKEALNSGEVRAAEPDSSSKTGWRVNPWVKKGILLGFRLGQLVRMGSESCLPFVDKDTFPVRKFSLEERVRVVPGGSSVRATSRTRPTTSSTRRCRPPT